MREGSFFLRIFGGKGGGSQQRGRKGGILFLFLKLILRWTLEAQNLFFFWGRLGVAAPPRAARPLRLGGNNHEGATGNNHGSGTMSLSTLVLKANNPDKAIVSLVT
jgi:hypothetical protein